MLSQNSLLRQGSLTSLRAMVRGSITTGMTVNISLKPPQGERFDLARGLSQRGTRGLLNINTASVERFRALPNCTKP